MVPFIANTGGRTRFGREYDQFTMESVKCEVPRESQMEISSKRRR